MVFETSSLCVSLFTTSAVLLGITVATLNFTHSTLLNPDVRENSLVLNEVDYKKILEDTTKILMAAGIIFIISIITNLYFLCTNCFTYLTFSASLFVFGCFLITLSLLVGKISVNFNTPTFKKPPEVK